MDSGWWIDVNLPPEENSTHENSGIDVNLPPGVNSSQEMERIDVHPAPTVTLPEEMGGIDVDPAAAVNPPEVGGIDVDNFFGGNPFPVMDFWEEMGGFDDYFPQAVDFPLEMEKFDINLPVIVNSSPEPAGGGASGDPLGLSLSFNSGAGTEDAPRRIEVIDVESSADEHDRAPMDVDVDIFNRFIDLTSDIGNARTVCGIENGVEEGIMEDDWFSFNIDQFTEKSSDADKSKKTLQNRSEGPWPSNAWMDWLQHRRDRDRSIAVDLAPKYAVYRDESGDKEDEPGALSSDVEQEGQDLPGPFSDARKIVEQRVLSRKTHSGEANILWKPSNNGNRKQLAPSLKDLSLKVLSKYSEEIPSLEGIYDPLKHSIVSVLCRYGTMNTHVLGLYLDESSTEIHLSNCCWATEEQLEKALAACKMDQLTVVQLDICGRCMTDHVLQAMLVKAPNGLPSLTRISLKGACRLSDDGLNALVSSAPLLSSINLGQCTLITTAGVISLADKLKSVLRELYIDDCHNIDVMLILPALKKLENLEILSVAGIPTVCDGFVRKLMPVCGRNMKELIFADCRELTNVAMKAIGAYCHQLCALDLRKLHRLNDTTMKYLADGCRSITKLKLCGNTFSDEAIAAFLEASGQSLTELSLNSIKKVSQQTAISISLHCYLKLRSLDLSFCRNIMDETLGLIVDSCINLRVLKLFGCRQITEMFLDGHSNSQVMIIGLKGPILEEIEMPNFI
ncbi:hypothetical protein COCNU_13G001410 [Cocos nucifera]|uniref:F-box/LRR-repeat protein 15-like leucin rich repeat domain-containing protein n=1 Tax=Cocos nucifera TaxID=13894 RepID=A0A8K0ISB1_COCNU|nr:hypothetical protein COCNU_13G001410 [Cocos nucifera]